MWEMHVKSFFREDQVLVMALLGKKVADSIYAAPPVKKSKIDLYSDAFEHFEKGKQVLHLYVLYSTLLGVERNEGQI